MISGERYLFRGKITYKTANPPNGNNERIGEWVIGGLSNVFNPDGVGIAVDPNTIKTEHFAYRFFRIDPDTIGQCTGLRDRHGILIFEGDILSDGVYLYRIDYSETNTGLTAYCYGDSDNWRWSLYHLATGHNQKREIEIIGNIHDRSISLRNGEHYGKY